MGLEDKQILSAADENNRRWNWKESILLSTLVAGVIGGGVGLASKHWRTRDLANIFAT